MGIFGHKDQSPTRGRDVSPVRDESPRHGGNSIFSRHRSVSPIDNTPRRSSASLNRNGTRNTAGSGGGGFFHHKNNEDQSITAARQRVINAEGMEREADKALIAARNAVKDAREQVKLLEAEAKEEARLAKIKAKAAGDISRRAKPLGRHDRF